jgi:hypothetical protein
VRSDLFISEPCQSQHVINGATFFVAKYFMLLQNFTINITNFMFLDCAFPYVRVMKPT